MDKLYTVNGMGDPKPIEAFYDVNFTGLCVKRIAELRLNDEAKVGIYGDIKVRRVK